MPVRCSRCRCRTSTYGYLLQRRRGIRSSRSPTPPARGRCRPVRPSGASAGRQPTLRNRSDRRLHERSITYGRRYRVSPPTAGRYSDLAIETALTLRLLSHLPLRQAEGFLPTLFGMMRLDLAAPDSTMLSRRSQHLRRRLRPVPPGEGLHRCRGRAEGITTSRLPPQCCNTSSSSASHLGLAGIRGHTEQAHPAVAYLEPRPASGSGTSAIRTRVGGLNRPCCQSKVTLSAVTVTTSRSTPYRVW